MLRLPVVVLLLSGCGAAAPAPDSSRARETPRAAAPVAPAAAAARIEWLGTAVRFTAVTGPCRLRLAADHVRDFGYGRPACVIPVTEVELGVYGCPISEGQAPDPYEYDAAGHLLRHFDVRYEWQGDAVVAVTAADGPRRDVSVEGDVVHVREGEEERDVAEVHLDAARRPAEVIDYMPTTLPMELSRTTLRFEGERLVETRTTLRTGSVSERVLDYCD